jgi:hypothetical protein
MWRSGTRSLTGAECVALHLTSGGTPADSPKMVTLSRSPPKFAMFFSTQRSAAVASWTPTDPDP